MKNKLFLLSLLSSLSLYGAEYDLKKGIDLTGSTSVTAAKLNQLVDNGTVADNKGMLLYTNSTPDTANNVRFTRFLWMDTSANPPTPKAYFTNGTLGINGYWTNVQATATIADGSVTEAKIAAGAVTVNKIGAGAVTYDKLGSGSVINSKLALNSVGSSNIYGLTIQSTNIANGQILSTNIGAAQVLNYHLAGGSIQLTNLASGFLLYGSNIANGTITSNHIANAGLNITNLPVNSITAAYMQAGVLPSSTNFTAVAMPAAGATTTVTHSLASIPQSIRVVLYCATADANTGYSVGDMLPYTAAGSAGQDIPEFSYWTTATTVNIIRISTGGTFYLLKKSDGVSTAVSSTANFNFRVYLTYTP